MRKGQTNISIASNHEIKERFQELFEQSQSNSKGDFLNQLLDDYSTHDPKELGELKRVQAKHTELSQNLDFFTSKLQKFVDAGKIRFDGKEYKINDHKHALFTILKLSETIIK